MELDNGYINISIYCIVLKNSACHYWPHKSQLPKISNSLRHDLKYYCINIKNSIKDILVAFMHSGLHDICHMMVYMRYKPSR